MEKRKTIKDIKEYLKNYDLKHECELVSDIMRGYQSPLNFHCNICGNDFERSFNGLQKAKHYCC